MLMLIIIGRKGFTASELRRGEMKMNRNRNKTLKQLLLRRRELLLNDIKAIEEESGQEVQYTGFDAAEQGSFDSEKEIEFSMLESKQEQLRKIDEALERLKNRRYGSCEICSKQIPLKRLRVIPFTELCVKCQQEFEQENNVPSEELEKSWSRLDSFARDPVVGEEVA